MLHKITLCSCNLMLGTYLAKFSLAFCPPLSESPRSPTKVISPKEKPLISYIFKMNVERDKIY